MLIVTTTTKTGAHHLHRDNCPRIGSKGVTSTPVDEAPASDVLDARPCSRCSPRAADVGRAIEAASAAGIARVAEEVKAKVAPDVATTDTAAAVPETQTCVGACGQTLPIKKFPTKAGGGRGKECRKCRDARLAAREEVGV